MNLISKDAGFECFGQYEVRMLQNECGYERKLFIEEGF